MSDTILGSNCPNVSKKSIHFQKRVGSVFSIPLKKGEFVSIFLAALTAAAVVFCLHKLMCAAVYW